MFFHETDYAADIFHRAKVFKMMVYSSEFGIHVDQMRIPRGCQCGVSVAGTANIPPSQTQTPSQAQTPSSSGAPPPGSSSSPATQSERAHRVFGL
ncbi:hypothetical protein BV898_19040 [Hypsibius exemplaris]|uniref:Uncharacterized protein n=1 Tax=Hypsibius exemplaris TaxID=2072580 RepID=A0A9X6NQ16_HYPEX|nr:hypothetical protein BV898_19040 [Hypsibius exemplaris]